MKLTKKLKNKLTLKTLFLVLLGGSVLTAYADNSILDNISGKFTTQDQSLYSVQIAPATMDGAKVRLMPYAPISQWKEANGEIMGTVNGWQQVGAEQIIYKELGKRIFVALLPKDAATKVNVIKTVHDDVTQSDWKQVSFPVTITPKYVTGNLEQLNAYGSDLEKNNCGSCHALIPADHYTTNQWVGIVNSMKGRTALTAAQARALTIYLQDSAKDSAKSAH